MDRRDALKLAAAFTASAMTNTLFAANEQTKKRALIIIDVQNEYFAGGALPVTYPQNSNANIVSAIKAAEETGIPIIMVQHSATAKNSKAFAKGTHGWELHESMKNAKVAHYVEKTLASSFVGTDLEVWLHTHSINTVVISGYMTQHCCDTTARYANHLGFGVEFLSDATGTLDFSNKAGKASAEEMHRSTLVEQAFRFSEVISTNDWIGKISSKS